MFILYLFIFLSAVFLLSKKDPNYSTSLSPSLMLLIMMLLYSFFGGLFILDITNISEIYYKYWTIQLLSILGVILSVLLNKFNLKTEIDRKLPNRKIKIIFLIIVIVHICLYITKYGGLSTILTNGYKLVYEDEDTNLLNFSILGLLASFALSFKMHKLIFLSSFLFFLIAIILGTRGIAISFLSISVMSYYLNNTRFNYKKIFYFIPLLIFFLIVAYVRNIGFSNILNLLTLDTEFYYSLFIKNSEFNTTGLVVYTGLSNPDWYENNVFEYIFGIIAAIIPKGLWSNRPDAISNLFSMKFAPPGEGIGFSVGYESYIIFGYFGPIVYYYFIQKVLQKFYCSKFFFINSLILFSPLLIMWVNRIDLQTILKVSLIYVVYCYFWKFFIKIIVE